MKKSISNTISLDEAMSRIGRWRGIQPPSNTTKGFFISTEDMRDLLAEIDACKGIGIRAYLAQTLDGMNDLVLVGVKSAKNPVTGVDFGKDILEDSKGNSLIYDLTTPCPNMCDIHSPLFSIHTKKEKTNLKDLPSK